MHRKATWKEIFNSNSHTVNGVNEWYVPSGRLGITELAERYARMVLCQLGAGKL